MEGIGGILAFTFGWLSAQVLKLVIEVIRKRGRLKFEDMVSCLARSGGMPSGHAASCAALTIYLGLSSGFGSGLFALSLGISLIVIYDAVNVRWAVGEQGKLLNHVAAKEGTKKKLRLVEGHTVPQVIVGGILGVLVGVGVFVLANNLFG